MNAGRQNAVSCIGEVEAGGRIRVSHAVIETVGAVPGTRVLVRIAIPGVDDDLAGKNVTEEEIDEIAAAQFEPREQVMKFLRSEGSLRKARRRGVRR